MPYFIGLAFLTATLLLLGVETTDTLSRSQKELWNLGHIVYFFLLLYLIGYLPLLKHVTTGKLFLGLILFSLILGGLIELSQYATGRTPDSQDLLRDLTGALLALAFLGRYNYRLKRKQLISFKIALVILLAVLITPLAKAVADEIVADYQFPVLASNDTPLELARWNGNANIEITRIESANLLKLQLTPGRQYPGTSLVYFPGDWSGYERLVIRLLNPSTRSLEITIKVHDRVHETAYLFHDRFNQSILIQPGWTDLKFELNEIEQAPRGRKMNMRQISNLAVFTSGLKESKTLYIDKIYLSR